MGHKDDIIKRLRKEIEDLKKQKGSDDDSGIKEYSFTGYKDWGPLEEVLPTVLETVEKARAKAWSWGRNWDCKYIDVRIDMRDGHVVLLNRNRERISVDQLVYQYNSETK